MIGNCPHDWLFRQVSCVIHHGGAGTTAAGLALGRPTIIVPFFGDQQFWGNIVARAGAGPAPIPHKNLNVQNLSNAIAKALEPSTLERAQTIALKMQEESGVRHGVNSFHRNLDPPVIQMLYSPESAGGLASQTYQNQPQCLCSNGSSEIREDQPRYARAVSLVPQSHHSCESFLLIRLQLPSNRV